jgi:hypothetical protein
MFIPEPSTSESVAVGTAAVTFPTVMGSGFYELVSDTACWIARALALAFADATFIADNSTDTLTFDDPHGLTTGDGPFRVSNSGVVAALPTGLLVGTDYWVIGDTVDTLKLATSFDNAQAGTAINLTTDGAGTRTLVDTGSTLDVTPLVVADVVFTTTFGADTLQIAAHGLLTGDGPVRVSNSGGALPGALLAATDYWVIKVDANNLKLATSYANAIAVTPINISDDGTGVHTLADTALTVRRAALVYADHTFTASASTDKLTISAHGLSTGDGPFRLTKTDDALPSGLTAGTDYWAVVTDLDSIQLATTYANAIAGSPTVVDFADDGVGTHTMSDTDATIEAGTGATAGTADGSMFVPALVPRTLVGSRTVAGDVRTKLSVIRNAANGRASLTELIQV